MSRTLGIKDFRKATVTAGTPVPLSVTKILTSFFRVRALAANTGAIYISNSSVSSNSDYLNAGDTITFDGAPITSMTHPQYDLSKIYIDSSVNGEGVIVTYQSFDD